MGRFPVRKGVLFMTNSSELVYEQRLAIAEFFDVGCAFDDTVYSIDDYNASICEIECLISHFIAVGNMNEVAELRKSLQQAKVAKRRAKKIINELERCAS